MPDDTGLLSAEEKENYLQWLKESDAKPCSCKQAPWRLLSYEMAIRPISTIPDEHNVHFRAVVVMCDRCARLAFYNARIIEDANKIDTVEESS